MRLISIGATTLFLCGAGPALGQNWIEFSNQQDRFTCNFPGQPTLTETTWTSEYQAELPARIYAAERGPSRYSVTVVDYDQAQPILTERAASCPPGAERCSGGDLTGEGYWRHDVRGAMLYATWTFLQRDATLTHLGYNSVDRVEGHQLHLTNNTDQSRTFVSIYMHLDKLYVLEGTVPSGYPEPALFQQSLGWLDEDGLGLRYQSSYSNGFPVPPRVPAQPRNDD
ncbi:MAG: hypothetical protein VX453_07860 [Acidobacteriota bacterium]|nr:hypothetical protein [Acidobacteriota bacterium]